MQHPPSEKDSGTLIHQKRRDEYILHLGQLAYQAYRSGNAPSVEKNEVYSTLDSLYESRNFLDQTTVIKTQRRKFDISIKQHLFYLGQLIIAQFQSGASLQDDLVKVCKTIESISNQNDAISAMPIVQAAPVTVSQPIPQTVGIAVTGKSQLRKIPTWVYAGAGFVCCLLIGLVIGIALSGGNGGTGPGNNDTNAAYDRTDTLEDAFLGHWEGYIRTNPNMTYDLYVSDNEITFLVTGSVGEHYTYEYYDSNESGDWMEIQIVPDGNIRSDGTFSPLPASYYYDITLDFNSARESFYVSEYPGSYLMFPTDDIVWEYSGISQYP